jgi:hypothetical protein
MTTSTSRADHDLLIRLETKMDQVIGDVKDLKDGTQRRLDALENVKVNREEFSNFVKDHEARVRRIERLGALIAGALAVLQFLIPIIIKYVLKWS